MGAADHRSLRSDSYVRIMQHVVCGNWLAISKICYVLLAALVYVVRSAEGGKDVRMLHSLVFNNRL
jgi:hypothetical protein